VGLSQLDGAQFSRVEPATCFRDRQGCQLMHDAPVFLRLVRPGVRLVVHWSFK
jgi:hypothetical protein